MLTTEDLRGEKKEETFPWNALIHSFKQRWIYQQIMKSKFQCLLHQSLQAFRKNSSNVLVLTVKHFCKGFKVNYCPIILLKKWRQNSICFRLHLTLFDLWFSLKNILELPLYCVSISLSFASVWHSIQLCGFRIMYSSSLLLMDLWVVFNLGNLFFFLVFNPWESGL